MTQQNHGRGKGIFLHSWLLNFSLMLAEQPSQGASELSKAAKDACPQSATSPPPEESEAEEPLQGFESDQVFPADHAGLG